MNQIARQFGIRDQHIAQACDAYDIARPRTGHWQKIEHGQSVQTGALSNDRFGEDEIIVVGKGASGEHLPADERNSTSGSADQIGRLSETSWAGGVARPSSSRSRENDMAIDDVEALLERNGLADKLVELRDAASDSFDSDDPEALAKIRLILRVLSLPPGSTGMLLKLIEEKDLSPKRSDLVAAKERNDYGDR
ncbi:MAG: hypothetical protein EOR72_25745 [Mesorhizobium sp.]|uniref:hypothetical protein n=1 Tax=Mesorhizobium sp. TaxID=1871066 RepID=UPI000FEA0BBD|nr:hypothetical protein [Mesorhizobium sp.]RWM09727.1 MAG: hypothetical protein EOR72_25745 [Mesorhizobium sp.]